MRQDHARRRTAINHVADRDLFRDVPDALITSEITNADEALATVKEVNPQRQPI